MGKYFIKKAVTKAYTNKVLNVAAKKRDDLFVYAKSLAYRYKMQPTATNKKELEVAAHIANETWWKLFSSKLKIQDRHEVRKLPSKVQADIRRVMKDMVGFKDA